MNVRIPNRFSLRTMLLAMAIVGVAIALVRDYVGVRNARYQYGGMNSRWISWRITIEDLVAASERLAEQEADSPWITMRAAEDRHVARMKEIWDRLDAYYMELSEKSKLKARDLLQRNFDKHNRRITTDTRDVTAPQ